MTRTEHTAKTRSTKTGFFATLAARSPVKGTGAPSSTRGGTAFAATVLSLFGLLALASPALAAAPTVTVEPASEVGYLTAHVKGSVDPADHPTTYRFQYITDAQFQENLTNSLPGFEFASSAGEESLPEGAGSTPVEATLENLAPNTTYHLRLFAENSGVEPIETDEDTAATFTTKATTQPTVAIELPSGVSYLKAHLSGSVDPKGGNLNTIGGPIPIFWTLQVARADEPGNWQFAGGEEISGVQAEANSPIPVEGEAEGLQPATEYLSRLIASNAGGQVASVEEPSFETLAVAPPAVSIEPITSFTATTAHLQGEVDPQGADPAFNSSCRFDYVGDAGFIEAGESFAFASSVPCEPETLEGAGAQEVTADLSGLTPHSAYHVRLLASNAGGTSEAIAPETLITKVQIPLIEATSAANVTSTSADLRTLINPGGAATTYHFEYGTTSAYGHASPESVSIGSDNASHPVGLHIAGLAPETTYHYRAVATNSASPIGGDAGPDRTFTTQPAGSDSVLPDGRQWELVSPPDKHGAEVENKLFFVGGIMQAAENGDAVTYITNAPIDGSSQSNPTENQILSKRSPGGWSSQGIATPHAGGAGREFVESGGFNLVRSNEGSEYLAFSPDLSLAFVQPEAYTPLAPPAPAPKRVNGTYDSGYVRDNNTGTYSITKKNSKEWYDEQLALSQPPPKCDAASSPVGATVGTEGVQAVSQDGCYVYFNSAAGAGPLEVAHYDGAAWATTLVSSLLGPGDIRWGDGGFAELSPNGRYLTFMSSQSLTGYDNTDANSPVGEPRADQEVFLYDAATDSLTCPSCDPTGARPLGQFDTSPTGNPQTPGKLQVDPAHYFLGSWLAGLLAPFPLAEQSTALTIGPLYSHQPRYLTDSGELFFESPVALVPRDVNGTWDVYEYRPQGVGGCAEASGCPALISSGRSNDESVLIEASADGSDVFFFTSERLSGQDIDHINDVYDAHVCSAALPCPPPPPPSPPACQGDACQPPATPPNDQTPGSLTFNGAGNLTECPKGKVKKGTRCVATKHKAKKHKHKKSHRAASHKRGGSK